MTELKPCPFCGGKAYIDVLLGKQYIQCFHKKNCLMKPDTWLISYNSIKKQIKAWNRRVKESELQRLMKGE